MIRLLLSLFRPLAGMAADLRMLRELYELDMQSRGLYRRVEKPEKDDTEVSYSHEEPTEQRRGLAAWLRRGEEDQIRGED